MKTTFMFSQEINIDVDEPRKVEVECEFTYDGNEVHQSTPVTPIKGERVSNRELKHIEAIEAEKVFDMEEVWVVAAEEQCEQAMSRLEDR